MEEMYAALCMCTCEKRQHFMQRRLNHSGVEGGIAFRRVYPAKAYTTSCACRFVRGVLLLVLVTGETKVNSEDLYWSLSKTLVPVGGDKILFYMMTTMELPTLYCEDFFRFYLIFTPQRLHYTQAANQYPFTQQFQVIAIYFILWKNLDNAGCNIR